MFTLYCMIAFPVVALFGLAQVLRHEEFCKELWWRNGKAEAKFQAYLDSKKPPR